MELFVELRMFEGQWTGVAIILSDMIKNYSKTQLAKKNYETDFIIYKKFLLVQQVSNL